MELIVGALAVLLVVIVVEALPVTVRPNHELALIAVGGFAAAWALFNKFDVSVVTWGFGIAGLTIVLRVAYRLCRAWADRTEVANLLQMQQRSR